MIQHNRIVTYGLTEEENTFVAQNLPTKEYILWDGENYLELTTVGCSALIVFGPALTEEETADIADYYTEIGGPTDETVIWLGESALPPELKRKFKCYPNFDAIAGKLKYLLLDAHKCHLESVEFSNRVAMILRVLREIKTNRPRRCQRSWNCPPERFSDISRLCGWQENSSTMTAQSGAGS